MGTTELKGTLGLGLPPHRRLTIRMPDEILEMPFGDSDIAFGNSLFATGHSWSWLAKEARATPFTQRQPAKKDPEP